MLRQADLDSLQKAWVFYLDAARRVAETREVVFASRSELIRRLEPDLDRCSAIEVWQNRNCILCLKAHGSVETNCGRPARPTDLKPCC